MALMTSKYFNSIRTNVNRTNSTSKREYNCEKLVPNAPKPKMNDANEVTEEAAAVLQDVGTALRFIK